MGKGLAVLPWSFIGWLWVFWGLSLAQPCQTPYDLRYLDSVWLSTPETVRWLSRHIKRYDLVEARTGARLTKAFMQQWHKAELAALCREGKRWQWVWVLGSDTTVWLSRPFSLRALSRHLELLRGPAAQPLTVMIGIPLRFRSADLAEQETALGWQPHGVSSWESLLVAPLALKAGYSPAGITALALVAQKRSTGYRLLAVQLYGRNSAFLPRDEVLKTYRRKELSCDFLRRLQLLARENPPYGYVIRLNDYYPKTVAEGAVWTLFLNEATFPRPEVLLDALGQVKSTFLERLGLSPRLPVLYWE